MRRHFIFRATKGSPYSTVSCRFCILYRGSDGNYDGGGGGGDGVAVVIRDSLLYAVTWQARKGRLEIPGSRRRASSSSSAYNSTRMRASSRIGITITTYIYVGESSGSREDPFTARNREFRVTLRKPREGIGFGRGIYVYTVTVMLQVTASLQVTRGFINRL